MYLVVKPKGFQERHGEIHFKKLDGNLKLHKHVLLAVSKAEGLRKGAGGNFPALGLKPFP